MRRSLVLSACSLFCWRRAGSTASGPGGRHAAHRRNCLELSISRPRVAKLRTRSSRIVCSPATVEIPRRQYQGENQDLQAAPNKIAIVSNRPAGKTTQATDG